MQRLVWWIQWHRRIGVVVAVLVILLAVTGVLINHSQQLGWNQTPVYSAWLAKLYGIPQTTVENGFAAGPHWLVQVDSQLMLGARAVAECRAELAGAAVYQNLIAALCGDTVLLLDAEGQLVESLTLPQPGTALAAQDETLWLRGSQGALRFDEESGGWRLDATVAALSWSESRPLPETLQVEVNADRPVPGLTREQVLLDLHSGRLFGNAGVWVVDIVGILICLLAFSGLLTWFGRLSRRLRRRH